MTQHEHTWLQIMLVVSGAVLGVFLCFATVSAAHGHEAKRPDLNEWYKTLKSNKGPCCGGPDIDATELNDLQWRTKGKSYEVFIDNEWVGVPEEALVDVPNRAGGARVWLNYIDGHPVIRCFMPGMLT